MDTKYWQDKKVTVMGLGLFGGGVGVTKFLARSGAQVTVTDLRPTDQLKESLDLLASVLRSSTLRSSTATEDGTTKDEQVDIKYTLGGHKEEDFTGADLVIVNPAVPEDSPYLKLIRDKGISIDTETNLIFKLCPCPIIGITGTNGKTTTTALLGKMLKGTYRKVWVGGNIGQKSLLEDIELISPEDIAVLELSSFQLQDLNLVKQGPQYSVVLNIRPNHLDRHKTMENYINAKKNIIKYQSSDAYTVLNADDPEVASWQSICPGQVAFWARDATRHRVGVQKDKIVAFLQDGQFWLRDNAEMHPICKITDTKLLGEFNQENILAAIATAHITGTPNQPITQAIKTFPGVEHRLEFVTEIDSISYYNDSIATNPEATISALRTIKGPIILIAGGYDKQLPLNSLVHKISRRVKAVVLIGQTASQIETLLLKEATVVKMIRSTTLPQAVQEARKIVVPGDTILLSPACASYDMFRNFVERGKIFKETVLNSLQLSGLIRPAGQVKQTGLR